MPGTGDLIAARLGTRNEFYAQRGQTDIFIRRKPADRDRPNYLAVLPQRNTASPTHIVGIAVVGNVMAFFGMLNLFAYLFSCLAFARRSPSLVHGNSAGGYRSSVHPGETD